MRKISRAGLIRKVDSAFSRYIRQKYADTDGMVVCVTCGRSLPWKEADAGHFVSRMHHAVRFDERNVHPQDTGCNRFRNGALDEYGLFIVRTYGQETLEDLLRLKHTSKRWTVAELNALLAKYQES